MTKIIVDGTEIDVPPEYTLLQACEAAGAEIPRFCYHERLSIAGNCRMCLVEVKGAPKPVASCAQQVRDQRPGPNGEPPVVNTRSPLVRRAREGVMEFLLINHPLDCPVCDQGGECDLQDQAIGYGRAGSRFDENKRAVEDKFMGPLIKTVMNRCIQCTRCVRFATEIAGVPELGASGRGEDMEITTYLEGALTSELQGNMVDLCPVGALTSKPYAFNARPWELRRTETIDVMDALGSNIRVDARQGEVLRVLPRVQEEINEEWISDKTRHAVDGLRRQRLDRPYVRVDGRLREASWGEALSMAADALRPCGGAVGAIAGDLACVESMKATLDLFTALGSPNVDGRPDGLVLGGGPRESWLFNAGIAGIDEADAILLVGTNPRIEAPVLNARLRRAWLRGAEIASVGAAADLTYRVTQLGEDGGALERLLAGEEDWATRLEGARRPMVIVGQGALIRPDSAALLRAVGQLCARFGISGREAGWNGYCVLHTAAARVGALDLGFVPGPGGLDAAAMVRAMDAGSLSALWLLGVDEIDLPAPGRGTVIYVGTHGDRGAHRADIVLPAAAYTEKAAIFVNTEGRVQMTQRAAFPKGAAREDWAIVRALSERLGHRLPYDSHAQLHQRLLADHPVFASLDHAPRRDFPAGFDVASLGAAGTLSSAALVSPVRDFYLTNPIARASVVMAECAASRRAAPVLMAAE
jgi:NADH-quinone oxidoreductase subunit G